MSKSDNVPVMYQTIPAGFDPMKLLRKAVSAITGEPVLRLELPYKKLWFKKSHPNGRIYVKPLRLTEQIAIYEAQVFLNRDDNMPICSYTASISKENASDGQFAEKAQYEAVDNALADAGFGFQIPDSTAPQVIRYYGSEIPVSAYPGTAPKAVHRPAAKPVQTSVKVVVQPPAVAEQTVPAAQMKTEVSTAQTAVQAGVQAATKAEPVAVTKAEPVAIPKAEPIIQEAPAVKAEPVQPVVAPEVRPVTEAHAANAALELLRGGVVTQPATAESAPAEKDAFRDLPFTIGPAYNNEMPVERIASIMTLEQAKAVVVDDGMSKGLTMGEVAEKRPASLQFYLSVGYKKKNNILKAAAQILLNERQKAS